MDIALLSKMIKEIILDEDELTLPGIGTFIAEVVPSTFSDKGYTINPPYRRLYFTQKQGSDTLLTDFYSRSNSVSRETASRIMSSFMQNLKETLKERKGVTFPGLGRLRATKENYFFFVPDEDLDIYPYGFGLERISLKTHVETEEEVAIAVENLAEILQEPEPETETKAETETVPVAGPVEKPVRRHLGWRILLWILIVLFALAALALGAFLLAAHFYPDFIDRLLYSPEELELLRNMQL